MAKTKPGTVTFGELKCLVSAAGRKYNAVFRVAKIRPNYAEIICISDIYKTRCKTRMVDSSAIRTWDDFLAECRKMAEEEGFRILRKDWSFSYRK